ncbi:bifunctional adenosylcobinamide kinase/adenosylcobinamide-phosphate guanylyltransferase [Sphingobium aquiterrae]|uniref:bifunctional adenosylcobinamide kinase/adenosylcobinamide-phosphate guanylyltransferase n=1 Tax=Sphingobium aquiterrae TaxID=2038656 RepID=UPI00301B35E7
MTSILILGGARSGKSRHAQARAEALPGALLYIATGQALDEEMAERIARHREDRGPRWRTIAAPFALPEAIEEAAGDEQVLLVDCLTLWLSNLMLAGHDLEDAAESLADAVGHAPGTVILVANEVGLGIVPENALARRFRDAAGRLNQKVAGCADEVLLVAAGLPLRLK